MKEIIQKLKDLQSKLVDLKKFLNVVQKKQQILELEDLMQELGFWDDNAKARDVAQRLDGLKDLVDNYEKLERDVSEGLSVAQTAYDEGDHSLQSDLEADIEKITKKLDQLELVVFFSGKYDDHGAIISIHAGAGGVDAQDWAEMLQNMYSKLATEQNWQQEMIQSSKGEEAGIKSVMFEIKGLHVFGYLKHETGVHRLVRISPYDADHARHTSFAYVEVLPTMEEAEMELDEKELRIDTFRSSGPGGQSVNTTDSAVRVTHEPSGISVSMQSERSQLQNKEQAIKILTAKLEQYNLAEAEEERQRLRGEFTENAWGHQIRSYVLHPYKLVKDHRTNYEAQDVEAVLNGKLHDMLENNVRVLGEYDTQKHND